MTTGRRSGEGPAQPRSDCAGRLFSVDGIDLYEFRDGLLAHISTVYDLGDWSRQIGLLPGRGGRAERIAVRAQRLAMRLRGPRLSPGPAGEPVGDDSP